MNSTISKSDFLKFKECSSLFWFRKNAPTMLSKEKEDPFVDRIKAQGQIVEIVARGLFQEAILIKEFGIEAVKETKELLDKGSKAFFQATFEFDGLLTMTDVLIWNDMFKAWDLYEIKASSSHDVKNDIHLLDASFQRIVLEGVDIRVANVYLIELNRDYYLQEELDIDKLFTISEITTEVIDIEEGVKADIQAAKSLLDQPEPKDCSCKYKGRSRHCQVFPYLYPETPDYSVYDFNSIGTSKKRLAALVDSGILSISDVPEDHDLLPKHKNQRWVHVNKDVIFDKAKIRTAFDNLVYPLYFLDYETLPSAIPKFRGTYPYQQVVVQYSLHILNIEGKVGHREFLHCDNTTPIHIVSQRLREDIGDEGSIVIWNRSFEGKCHKDLAKANPDLESFLLGLNDRIFDLMVLFKNQYYLHDDFRGKSSIKDVLPVMCPELSYKELAISNGSLACMRYEEAIFGNLTYVEKKAIFNELLKYCELDTWAMVRIFQELVKMVSV